jgi:hypothetical protein
MQITKNEISMRKWLEAVEQTGRVQALPSPKSRLMPFTNWVLVNGLVM